MKSKKATSSPMSMILFIGVIMIFLTVLVWFTADKALSIVELKNKMDKLAFFEKSKSILNTLGNLEAGEVTEVLGKDATVEFKSNTTGNYFKVDDLEGKIYADVEKGLFNGDKITFEKKSGKIKLRGGKRN